LNPSEVERLFQLKSPLFQDIQKQTGKDYRVFAKRLNATIVLARRVCTPRSGSKTAKKYQRQQTSSELSPGAVSDGKAFGAAVIGTLDSERTKVVMENLLQEIVRSESWYADYPIIPGSRP